MSLETPIHSEDEVGATIRKIREAKGWTQAKLARELGVSQKDISRWENGPSLVGTKNFIQVLDAMNATIWVRYRPE